MIVTSSPSVAKPFVVSVMSTPVSLTNHQKLTLFRFHRFYRRGVQTKQEMPKGQECQFSGILS